jgi:salicylate hydroxylase
LKELATNCDGYGPPAEIRTSSKVVTCDPEEGQVTLANGDTVKGDIIIGADGM